MQTTRRVMRIGKMDISEVWETLVQPEGGTIVYLVLDGLGGLPDPERGQTEAVPDRLAMGRQRDRVHVAGYSVPNRWRRSTRVVEVQSGVMRVEPRRSALAPSDTAEIMRRWPSSASSR